MNREDGFYDLAPDMGQEDRKPLDEELDELKEIIEEASEPERDLLQHYCKEAQKIPLLAPDEEKALAIQSQNDDTEARKSLIQGNLRLVIKIALEFQKYWTRNTLDLIQEGNIGLMHAIKKFDPYRGIKLSYYASFWIKAYILSYLMKNWKLVKIGTTVVQRKLFYNLKREKNRLRALGFDPDPEAIAKSLNVKESEVVEMDQRLSGWELSLDAPLKEGSKDHYIDSLPTADPQVIDTIADARKSDLLQQDLDEFRLGLNKREIDILNLRILADKPMKLEGIGKIHQVSRERIRQIEKRLKQKFSIFLKTRKAEEKKQWAKNLIKNLIRKRDEKKSKCFAPVRQSGEPSDEFTIRWIDPDEIGPPAKFDEEKQKEVKTPPPMSALKTRTEITQKEDNSMDKNLPKLVHLLGYYFARKLRDKNINETSDLLKLSSLQFEKLSFKPKTVQAIVSEMLKTGYFFSGDEEATRELLSRYPLGKKKLPEPDIPAPPGGAAADPGSSVSAAADPPADDPNSFKSNLGGIGSALDIMKQKDRLSLRVNFEGPEKRRYRVTIEEYSLPPVE